MANPTKIIETQMAEASKDLIIQDQRKMLIEAQKLVREAVAQRDSARGEVRRLLDRHLSVLNILLNMQQRWWWAFVPRVTKHAVAAYADMAGATRVYKL